MNDADHFDEACARLLGQVTILQLAFSKLLDTSTLDVREQVTAKLQAIIVQKESSSSGFYGAGMTQLALVILK